MIVLKGILTRLGLFYASRLVNCVYLEAFAHGNMIWYQVFLSNKNNFWTDLIFYKVLWWMHQLTMLMQRHWCVIFAQWRERWSCKPEIMSSILIDDKMLVIFYKDFWWMHELTMLMQTQWRVVIAQWWEFDLVTQRSWVKSSLMTKCQWSFTRFNENASINDADAKAFMCHRSSVVRTLVL